MAYKKDNNFGTLGVIIDCVKSSGPLMKILLSFMITLGCAISDGKNIFVNFELLQNEDALSQWIYTIAVCIFLDFSVYIAGTVIVRMLFKRYIANSKAVSLFVVAICISLFVGVFCLCFNLRYEMRYALYGIQDSSSQIVNKVKDAVSTVMPGVDEDRLISLTASFIGSLPAFTSILSMASVLLLYNPIESDNAVRALKLSFMKYKVIQINKAIHQNALEAKRYYDLITVGFAEAVNNEFQRFCSHVNSISAAELKAKNAFVSAVCEINKEDQDKVTRILASFDKLTFERAVNPVVTLKQLPLPNEIKSSLAPTAPGDRDTVLKSVSSAGLFTDIPEECDITRRSEEESPSSKEESTIDDALDDDTIIFDGAPGHGTESIDDAAVDEEDTKPFEFCTSSASSSTTGTGSKKPPLVVTEDDVDTPYIPDWIKHSKAI